MHDQPYQPLNDLEALRKCLRGLLDEVYVVRSTVEAICSHENEAEVCNDKGDAAGSCSETDTAATLTNALEACHITLREDEADQEIVHVYKYDKRIQTFSTAEWQWMHDDGTWPWEHEQDDLFLPPDPSLE